MGKNIAVLMAAYNTEKTLLQAVESILNNTEPCQIFIVDDASTLPVTKVLQPHPRITVLRLDSNQGLSGALNHGLAEILKQDYHYIARMDTDDIAHPLRLEKQRQYMEQHPEIALVGTWARFFDENTGATTLYYTPPTTPEGIRRKLPFNSQVLHPSWFVRSDVFRQEGGYAAVESAAEDYHWLYRISARNRFANIPEYLIDYRVSSQGISEAKRKRQLINRLKTQLEFFTLSSLACWLGVMKTLLLFAVPHRALKSFKTKISRKK